MKKIRALFTDPKAARRTLKALSAAGFEDDDTFGLGYSEVELENESVGERKLIIVNAEDDQIDTAEVILKNGGAAKVETMAADWEPAPEWDIAAFSRPTNA